MASYHLEKKSLQFLAKWFLIGTTPEKGMPRLPAVVNSADTLPVGVKSQSGEKIVGCVRKEERPIRSKIKLLIPVLYVTSARRVKKIRGRCKPKGLMR